MVSIFENKIEKLGGIDLTVKASSEMDNEIHQLVPDYLKEILNKYGGCYFREDIVASDLQTIPVSSNGEIGIGEILDFRNDKNIEHIKSLDKRFFNSLIPFLDGLPGDYFLLGLNGEYSEKVYYWHHEAPEDSELYLAYYSFEEFVNKLKQESQGEDDREVVSFRLDF